MLKFDEKTEENRFNTILKFNFLLLYSRFTISKWKGKSLSRSQDTVSQYCSVSQGKNSNLSKKLEIRAFVFFLFKILIKKKLCPMIMFSNRKWRLDLLTLSTCLYYVCGPRNLCSKARKTKFGLVGTQGLSV